jgi:hypothetical protein
LDGGVYMDKRNEEVVDNGVKLSDQGFPDRYLFTSHLPNSLATNLHYTPAPAQLGCPEE